MPTQMELLKKLKNKMVKAFTDSNKQKWDKSEVVTRILAAWMEFLEHRLERK